MKTATIINLNSGNQAYQKANTKWKNTPVVIPQPSPADLHREEVYAQMDKVSAKFNTAQSWSELEAIDQEFNTLWNSVEHSDPEACPPPMKPRVEKRDENVVFVNFKR